MFFITLNFKRLINYHIDTLCRVEKFAGKCHNVFRTDLVDDTVEIAEVIELGMGAVVKLQVFRPVGHILFGKRLLVFLFKHQQIVFGVIFGDTFLYELPDLVVDNLAHPGTFGLRAFELHGKGLVVERVILRFRVELYPVGTTLVLADDLPEEVVEMLLQDVETDFIRRLGFQVVFVFDTDHVLLFGQS